MLFMFWINRAGFLIGLEEYRIQCKEYPMTINQQSRPLRLSMDGIDQKHLSIRLEIVPLNLKQEGGTKPPQSSTN